MNNLNSVILEGTVEKKFENSVIGLKVQCRISKEINVEYHFKVEMAYCFNTDKLKQLKTGSTIRVMGYLSNLGNETVVTCEHINIKK